MKDQRNYLHGLGNTELKITGWKFTWMKNNVRSKLDRAIVNAELNDSNASVGGKCFKSWLF